MKYSLTQLFIKTFLTEIYTGIAVIYFSFYIFVLVEEWSTDVAVYKFKARYPRCIFLYSCVRL